MSDASEHDVLRDEFEANVDDRFSCVVFGDLVDDGGEWWPIFTFNWYWFDVGACMILSFAGASFRYSILTSTSLLQSDRITFSQLCLSAANSVFNIFTFSVRCKLMHLNRYRYFLIIYIFSSSVSSHAKQSASNQNAWTISTLLCVSPWTHWSVLLFFL